MEHRTVSQGEWIKARKALLAREKELTRQIDRVAEERRALPWVEVTKDYVFEGPEGKETLSDLFGGNSQLIVYHFMFAPGWEEGCSGCSFISDHIDGANLHLAHHDVTLLAVSRAPWPEFAPFRERMGWKFKWMSSHGSDFNYDFHVTASPEQVAKGEAMYNYAKTDEAGEMHGLSVFYKDDQGRIFHTYSTYARGGDILIGAHNFLDLTPKGRNEKTTMDWMRLHDRYEDKPKAAHACCGGAVDAA